MPIHAVLNLFNSFEILKQMYGLYVIYVFYKLESFLDNSNFNN